VTVRPLPRRALAIVVTVAALASTACDSERRAISRDDLPDVPAEPDHVVELGDDGFDTDELEVLNSDLVEFRIVGEDDHGVRADTRIDTGLLFPGESTFVIFDEPGTYEVVDVTDEDQVLSVESVLDPDEE
jgi:plastocyanin